MPITISGDTPNFSAATITTGTVTTLTAPTSTITTLNAPSGVLATQNGMTGIAKAWVNFNGTGTIAIRDSFNVSSITDNGTGDYTVNFTTAMPNANYAIAGMTTKTNYCFVINDNTAPTTSAIRISVYDASTAGLTDRPYNSVVIFSS
jgi:hypothetical protein